jgi:hypothetical protein
MLGPIRWHLLRRDSDGSKQKYFLSHSFAEQRRLQQQSQELAHESTWLFDQVGIAAGSCYIATLIPY